MKPPASRVPLRATCFSSQPSSTDSVTWEEEKRMERQASSKT